MSDDPSDHFTKGYSLGEIRIPESLWRRVKRKRDQERAAGRLVGLWWSDCLIRELLTAWVADIEPIPRYGPHTAQVVEIFQRSQRATIRQVRRLGEAYTHELPHLPDSDFVRRVGLWEECDHALDDGYWRSGIQTYPIRIIPYEVQTHATYVIGETAAAVVLQDHLDPHVFATIYGRWENAMSGKREEDT